MATIVVSCFPYVYGTLLIVMLPSPVKVKTQWLCMMVYSMVSVMYVGLCCMLPRSCLIWLQPVSQSVSEWVCGTVIHTLPVCCCRAVSLWYWTQVLRPAWSITKAGYLPHLWARQACATIATPLCLFPRLIYIRGNDRETIEPWPGSL